MRSAIDGSAAARALGELYRTPRMTRGYHTLQREIEAGSEALTDIVHTWAAFAPRAAALDGAERTVQGLLRLIGELRVTLQGGPTDAP